MLEPTLPTTERKRFTWKWSWKGFFVALVVVVAAAGEIQKRFFPKPTPPTPPEVILAISPDTALPQFLTWSSSSTPAPGFLPPPCFGSAQGWPDPARPSVCELRMWTDEAGATSVLRFEPNDNAELGAGVAGKLTADLAHPMHIAASRSLSFNRPNSPSKGFGLFQPGKYEFIVYTLDLPPPAPAPTPTYEPRYWQPIPPYSPAPPAR